MTLLTAIVVRARLPGKRDIADGWLQLVAVDVGPPLSRLGGDGDRR